MNVLFRKKVLFFSLKEKKDYALSLCVFSVWRKRNFSSWTAKNFARKKILKPKQYIVHVFYVREFSGLFDFSEDLQMVWSKHCYTTSYIHIYQEFAKVIIKVVISMS